jgi:hypothetical protein
LNAGADLKPDFAKAVKLAPKQSIEVEIPVAAANDFGLTLMASNQISATLFTTKARLPAKIRRKLGSQPVVSFDLFR